MKIDLIYPKLTKRKRNTYSFVRFIGVLFIIGAFTCLLVNLITKGKPWSLIVLVGLFIAWKFLFSPSLIDYNPISQFLNLLSTVCLLLHFIDLFFSPGWGITVIPIVLFSGLIFVSLLLFTNYETQKHNVFPIYIYLVFTIVLSIFGLSLEYFKTKWVFIVLLSVSFFYVILCSFIVKNNIFKEFRKRFSIK